MCSKSVSSISTHISTSSLFKLVFFSSLRCKGSSAGGTTGVVGLLGDFIISLLFTATLSCVSVRFSPLLELATSGDSSVSTGSPAFLRLPPVLLFLLSHPQVSLVVHEEA